MLAEPTVVIISQYINQTVMLYAWNLYSDVCQLFLSKGGGKMLPKLYKLQALQTLDPPVQRENDELCLKILW